jgi:formylglycine-generating enzyme required for sulfatase activity
MGTPDYMAPEQWENTHTVDGRADLYALGCTLFFLLTGKAPFDDAEHSTMVHKMAGHSLHTPPSLKDRRPDVPDDISALYDQLLAKKPSERVPTADELASALSDAIRRNKGARAAVTEAETPPASARQAVSKSVEPDRDVQTSVEVAAAIPSSTPSREAGPAQSATESFPLSVASSSGRSRPNAQPVNPRRRSWILGFVGLIAVVFLGGIILKVKNREGSIADRKGTETKSQNDPKASTPGCYGWPADAPKPAIAPFNASAARQYQEGWAAYLNVPVEYENSIGMKFRLIPPGEFLMGSTSEEIEAALSDFRSNDKHHHETCKSEAPQHKVILTQPIFFGMTEVTQAQYEKVMGVNPSYFAPTGMGKEAVAGLKTADHPVEMVSWNDATEFCVQLCKEEKMKPFYFRDGETILPLDGTGYRLPSEAEWEFACRAGTTTKYWTGDKIEDLERAGWFGGDSDGRTHAVGELKSNPFGLADMHGNVWEWVQDGWDASSYSQFKEKFAINPSLSFVGSRRVFRGGNWRLFASHCRSSARFAHEPSLRDNFSFGFRVSLPVNAVRQALESVASNSPLATNAPETLPATFTNSLGMEFVKVPKGTGWLGGGGGRPGETKVEMTEDFYLGKYEVTQEEWEKVTGLSPSHFWRTGDGKDAVKDISDADLKRFPVERVSWDDAQLFLERLNKQEPSAGWVYRLPKEAEWEYACRGGSPSDKLDSAFDFYFDKPTNQLLLHQANFAPEPGKGLQQTCKVGSYQPNRLGRYDMHGNVWEWCADEEKAADGAVLKVPRGGSWHNDSSICLASNRYPISPSVQGNFVGLRLARVRVSPSQPLASGTDAPIDYAAERKAAEWVLKVGGTLQLESPLSEAISLREGKLPEGPFTVRAVDFVQLKVLKDDDLAPLGGRQRLQSLRISETQIDGEGLVHISHSRTLRGLILGNSQMTDVAMAHIASLTQLRSLDIRNSSGVTDAGLIHLQSLTNLELLGLPPSASERCETIDADHPSSGIVLRGRNDRCKPFPDDRAESETGSAAHESSSANSRTGRKKSRTA